MANLQTSMPGKTGTVELHHEPSALGLTAPAWVAVAMLVVIGIMIWQKVPALIAKALDGKIASIRQQLDEAAALRAEAETLLAGAKKRDASSAADAKAIVEHAEAEAKALLAKAKTDSQELVQRRGKMAEDKIAAAERTAVAEVRARAADVAARAATAIIAETHGAAADKPLVDKTIAGLGRLN
jgi:F-type H+-transporting ATPase subunit b